MMTSHKLSKTSIVLLLVGTLALNALVIDSAALQADPVENLPRANSMEQCDFQETECDEDEDECCCECEEVECTEYEEDCECEEEEECVKDLGVLIEDKWSTHAIRQRILPSINVREPYDTLTVAERRFLKTEEYMNSVVYKLKMYESVKETCRNQHEMCTAWAAFGYCTANPEDMLTLCAPACQSCDKLISIEDTDGNNRVHQKAYMEADDDLQYNANETSIHDRQQSWILNLQLSALSIERGTW